MLQDRPFQEILTYYFDIFYALFESKKFTNYYLSVNISTQIVSFDYVISDSNKIFNL